ncbi:MAG: outer membrane beta-barrel protein [Flavobacteriales bacterium]|nr:outer membrane beta-barrel protein [Flavobacteriales bacterium]
MRFPSRLCMATMLALCTFTAQAQKDDDDREGFNGLRAGWHYSDLESDDAESDARSGFYAGYYRNLIKIPLYRLSTGMEYTTAGGTSTTAGITSEARLAYISLAINNRFKIGPVYGDIGIDPGLRVGEKVLVNGTEVDLPDDAQAERFDMPVHIGAGFKVLFLSLELRYRYSVTEVYENTRNTGLQVGLSAFF